MQNIYVMAFILALAVPAISYAEDTPTGKCGVEYSEGNTGEAAKQLAIKALSAHKKEFQTSYPKVKNRKMPFNLKNQTDMEDFIDDILKKEKTATKNPQVKLDTVSKSLANDRTAWWEETTGTFIVFNPHDDDCGTAYRPDDGKVDYTKAT